MQALILLYEAHMLPYMWDCELEMRLIAESSPEYAFIRFLLAFIVLSQLCISLIYASPEVYQDHVDRDSTESRVAAAAAAVAAAAATEPESPSRVRRGSHHHRQIYPSSELYYREHVNKETSQPEPEVRKIVRVYQLYNRCSKKEVQIVGKGVFANAKPDSEFANLRVETDTFGSRVRIASAKYHTYLCFNRRGRLTVRHSGNSQKCVFQEHITEDKFTEFQSVENPRWYIGFRKNGKPLKGYQWTFKRQCYQFMKTDFPYSEIQDREDSQLGSEVDFQKIMTDFLTQEQDKT